MRLLLDEMYSQSIAEELRRRDHDVVAVTEHPELRGLRDEALLVYAASERRALVTENIAHFALLARRYAAEGRDHHGVVLVSARRFPRAEHAAGAFVRALDLLLREHPADDALAGLVHWL